MLDFFRTWLPQIIGYAESFADGTIQKAWAEGDRSRTSVYFSGELIEQVFGDLSADEMMCVARKRIGQHQALVQALELILHSLKQLDIWIEDHVDTDTWGKGETIPASVGSIFRSQEWWIAQQDAVALIAAVGEAGFSSKDFEPTP